RPAPRTPRCRGTALPTRWPSQALRRRTRSLARDQIGSHQLRRDAFGLGSVEIELDLDAVGIMEEKLEQRLAVGAALREADFFLSQVLEHAAQAGRAERDMVERAGAGLVRLRGAAEVFLLYVARHAGARPDVDDIDAPEVHPVHREAEVRMRA